MLLQVGPERAVPTADAAGFFPPHSRVHQIVILIIGLLLLTPNSECHHSKRSEQNYAADPAHNTANDLLLLGLQTRVRAPRATPI